MENEEENVLDAEKELIGILAEQILDDIHSEMNKAYKKNVWCGCYSY